MLERSSGKLAEHTGKFVRDESCGGIVQDYRREVP